MPGAGALERERLEEEIWADAVLVTVPLGVLKASRPSASPTSKQAAPRRRHRCPRRCPGRSSAPAHWRSARPCRCASGWPSSDIGFGLLNKVVLRFPINTLARGHRQPGPLLRAGPKGAAGGAAPATARSAACCRSPGEEEDDVSSGHGREVEAKKEETTKDPAVAETADRLELARRFNFRLLLGWC